MPDQSHQPPVDEVKTLMAVLCGRRENNIVNRILNVL